MKSRTQVFQLIALICTFPILFGFTAHYKNSIFSISAPEYGKLSEQYLMHIANFNWEESYKLLANDVVFKLPDGDVDTRTMYEGLDQVKKFWNSYEEKSGNNHVSFKDFVHIPVAVDQMVENIGLTGDFNLCYFSGELTYGSEIAKVRMHWAFHFNDEDQITGIYAYYDRTPIIEAAKKNFLQQNINTESSTNEMVVQAITIKSGLSETELIQTAKERAERFRETPGLLQKYYIRLAEPGTYGGIYIWDSKKSMMDYQQSDLAATIPTAYKVKEKPKVQISDLLFQLRE